LLSHARVLLKLHCHDEALVSDSESDHASADSAMAAVHAAHARDPEVVATEWQRLTGLPF
jgi:hypothetical protein